MRVVSFYRFARLDELEALRARVREACERRALLGTVLLAPEGINATLAGDEPALRELLDTLAGQRGLERLEGRWSDADEPPFRRLRVKLKRELVALGRPDIDPAAGTGEHVAPERWHALLDHDDLLLIDARNRYEVEVGHFPGALDPGTASFRDLPAFVEREIAGSRERPVAMYCTGGIRCEKASALLLAEGFREVYQLEGGILNYLDRMPAEESRWQGECFVFDTRVAVDPALRPGGYVQCHACRRPLRGADLASPHYREGVSCPHCAGELEPERAARLKERRRQVLLAERRGERHVGAVYERAKRR